LGVSVSSALPRKHKEIRLLKGTRFAPSMGPPLQTFSVDAWMRSSLDF